MADVTIGGIATSATVLADDDLIEVEQGGATKKAALTVLETLLGVTKTVVANDHSISVTTQTEVTELSQTLVAGTYRFSYYLIVQSATGSTGLTFSVNYTGTATRITYMLSWPDTGVTTAVGSIDDASVTSTGQLVCHSVSRTEGTTTATLNTGTIGVATVDVDCFVKIEGVIVVSDGGDLELWHGSETTTATRVEAGSNLIITRMA